MDTDMSKETDMSKFELFLSAVAAVVSLIIIIGCGGLAIWAVILIWPALGPGDPTDPATVITNCQAGPSGTVMCTYRDGHKDFQ